MPASIDVSVATADGTSKIISVPIVQELAGERPPELPERYIKSEEERPSPAKYSPRDDIPVVDISRLYLGSAEDRQNELKKLAIGSEEWGFFQVVNHGIPTSLMDRVRGIVREFFQLPLEERKEHAMVPGSRPEGYGQIFVASEDQRLDWRDVLVLRTLPPEDRNMRFWPKKPADFRETVAEYAVETQKLGHNLLSLLAENVGLESDCFINMFGRLSERIMVNYYPPCPRPDLALGVSAHSDMSGITMLMQGDDTEGLHIRKDGEWIGVRVIPDALVINMGDMMEVMSNGRYRSVEHRAVTHREKDRISIAAFMSPMPEAEIGPAPDLIDECHPCLYRRFVRSEFERNYFGSKQDGKKVLDLVKIPGSH